MHAKIDDIAVIKRAKDKTYPKDTIYLALSATDREVHISDSPINLNSRYCVIVPKVQINVIYLYYAMKKYEDYFFNTYVGDKINASFNDICYFPVDIDTDLSIQEKVVDDFLKVERQIQNIENEINQYKEMKKWFLAKMFLNQK